jgi:hypothetical protein
MKTLTNESTPAPQPITEATRVENHDHAKASSVLESSRRGTEIVVAAGKHLPTLSEMTNDLESITSQIAYWEEVKDAARAEVNGFSSKLRNAENVLLETKDATSFQDRSDRDRATMTVEYLAPKLKLQERRVENAAAQLKTWKKRLSEFDRVRFAKLKKEDERRRDLVPTKGLSPAGNPRGW